MSNDKWRGRVQKRYSLLRDMFDGGGFGRQNWERQQAKTQKAIDAAKSIMEGGGDMAKASQALAAAGKSNQQLLALMKPYLSDLDGDGDVDAKDLDLFMNRLAGNTKSTVPKAAGGGSIRRLRCLIMAEVSLDGAVSVPVVTFTKVADGDAYVGPSFKIQLKYGSSNIQQLGLQAFSGVTPQGYAYAHELRFPWSGKIVGMEIRHVQCSEQLDKDGFALDVLVADTAKQAPYLGPVMMAAETDRSQNSEGVTGLSIPVANNVGCAILSLGVVGQNVAMSNYSTPKQAVYELILEVA